MSAGPVTGFGLATTAQLEPVRRSIRVRSAVPSEISPTAQMLLAEVAATAFSMLSSPGGPALALGTLLQAVPVQCTVSVR